MEKKDFEKVQTLKANLRHCKKKFLKSKSVAKVASVGGGVLGTLVGIFAGLNTYDGLYRNNLQHINEIELSSVNAGFYLNSAVAGGIAGIGSFVLVAGIPLALSAIAKYKYENATDDYQEEHFHFKEKFPHVNEDERQK